MKTWKYITAVAAFASLLVGCNNDGHPETDALTGKPVVIHAGVDVPASRAGMTTDNLTTLGLTIVNANSTAHSCSNVKYEKNGTDFSAAAGEQIPHWQNETQEVTVTAYSPYTTNWTDEQAFAVQTDQSTAEAAKTSDLLWVQDVVKPDEATQTGNITYHGGFLNINLQHRMSKLVVNLRYLNEVDATAQSLKVMYLSPGCTIDTQTGVIRNVGAAEDITAYKEANAAEGYTDCFEAIFPPQHMAFKLELLLDNNQDYEYHNPAFEFQSGVAYILNLTVGKDKVEFESVTATNWGHIVGGKLETE